MFIATPDYKAHIDKIIADSDSVDFAIAFWGKGAMKYLANSGKRFRILCNLTSGGTNPAEIDALRVHHDVRHLDNLHAKVCIGDKLALVGSANVSTNGLNIQEDEFDGWQEAGYVTDKVEDLAQMRHWFVRQWTQGVEVTSKLIQEAQADWDLRFKSRIPRTRQVAGSILSMPPSELDGRDIYVALWRDPPSPEGKQAAVSWTEQAEARAESAKEWDFFEDWEEMQVGQKIVSVYVGAKGAIRVDGAYEVFEVLQVVREDPASEGRAMTLHVCYKLNELIGRALTPADCNLLATQIQQSGLARRLYNEGSTFVPFATFVRAF